MARSIRIVGNGVLWLAVGVACSSVATCGQKGPLEMPDDDATASPSPREFASRFARAADINEGRALFGPRCADHGGRDHALRA